MEDISILFGLGLLLFVLIGPWIFVAVVNGRRKRERAEDQRRVGELTKRVYALEQAAREHAAPAPPQTPAQAQPVPPLVAPAPVAAAPSAPKPTAPPLAEVPAIATPVASAPSTIVTPPPVFAKSEPATSMVNRFKGWLDIEETLGTNWLNKLGIVILVLGVAFFLAYQLKTLGPAGKILVGYVVSGVLLGAGVWFERQDRYRILARAGVGGGWALLFLHHLRDVPRTRGAGDSVAAHGPCSAACRRRRHGVAHLALPFAGRHRPRISAGVSHCDRQPFERLQPLGRRGAGCGPRRDRRAHAVVRA